MRNIVTFIVFLSCISCYAQEEIKIYETFDTFEEDILKPKMDDKTYVINFWATWCGPCVKEMPYFLQTMKDNEELDFTYVSLDFPKQVESKLIPFTKKNNMLSHTVLLNDSNTNEWIDKITPKWSGAIPITVVKKNDNYHYILNAIHSEEELMQEINKINK